MSRNYRYFLIRVNIMHPASGMSFETKQTIRVPVPEVADELMLDASVAGYAQDFVDKMVRMNYGEISEREYNAYAEHGEERPVRDQEKTSWFERLLRRL